MRTILGALPIFLASTGLLAVELKPETETAFDHYVQATEAELNGRTGRSFLWMDQHPNDKNRVWVGESVVVPHKSLDRGQPIDVPNGMVQDWIGLMYLPGVTVEKVRDVLQNYAEYKNYFQPEVTDSKELKREGDRFDVSLRLYKKQFITVVLNTTYSVQYTFPDPMRMSIVSRSTHIGQIKNPKKKDSAEERSPSGGDGLLWRLNSYWRFHQADNGVYAELEALSLSRDVPFGLGSLLKGFLEQFPKESIENTMRGVRRAVGLPVP